MQPPRRLEVRPILSPQCCDRPRTRKDPKVPPRKAAADALVDPMEKIARLVAIYVTRDMPAEEAAVRLLGAGFDSGIIGGSSQQESELCKHCKVQVQDEELIS